MIRAISVVRAAQVVGTTLRSVQQEVALTAASLFLFVSTCLVDGSSVTVRIVSRVRRGGHVAFVF